VAQPLLPKVFNASLFFVYDIKLLFDPSCASLLFSRSIALEISGDFFYCSCLFLCPRGRSSNSTHTYTHTYTHTHTHTHIHVYNICTHIHTYTNSNAYPDEHCNMTPLPTHSSLLSRHISASYSSERPFHCFPLLFLHYGLFVCEGFYGRN
ncbi:hypothetical protein LOAG_05091, partial [Loa loa]